MLICISLQIYNQFHDTQIVITYVLIFEINYTKYSIFKMLLFYP